MSLNVRIRTWGHVRPAQIQISLRIRAVWSESSLGAFWVAKDIKLLYRDNEDPDQTSRMLVELSLRFAYMLDGISSHVNANIIRHNCVLVPGILICICTNIQTWHRADRLKPIILIWITFLIIDNNLCGVWWSTISKNNRHFFQELIALYCLPTCFYIRVRQSLYKVSRRQARNALPNNSVSPTDKHIMYYLWTIQSFQSTSN